MWRWGTCIRNGAICGILLWFFLLVTNQVNATENIVLYILIGIIIVCFIKIIKGWIESCDKYITSSSYRSKLEKVKKEAEHLSKKLEQSPAVEYLTNKLVEKGPDSYYVSENSLFWTNKNGENHKLIFDQNGIPDLKPIIFDKLPNNHPDDRNTFFKFQKDNPNLHCVVSRDIANSDYYNYVICIDQCILVGGLIAEKLLTKCNVSYEYVNGHWKCKYVIDKNW